MDKDKTIQKMWKIWQQIDDFDAFAGQAVLKDKVKRQIDFLEAHKTDAHLEGLLFKECNRLLSKVWGLVAKKGTRPKSSLFS